MNDAEKKMIWCGYSLTIAWNNNNGEVYGIFVCLRAGECVILKVCKLSVGSIEMKITDMCHFKDITSNATAFLRDYTFFSALLFCLSISSLAVGFSLCVSLYPVDFLLKLANFLAVGWQPNNNNIGFWDFSPEWNIMRIAWKTAFSYFTIGL